MIFPAHFLFGVATSSHQIEGNLQNNWTEWEHSEKRAQELRFQGKNPVKYYSGNASFHAQKMEEDIDLMASLHLQAYRFSIEWSRIVPEEGVVNPEGLAFYDRLFTKLSEKKIVPFVTLWHWSVPVWLEQKGGLLASSFSKHFHFYVEALLPLFQKHTVQYIMTWNEPLVFSAAAYLKGIFPPQKKSLFSFFRAVYHLIQTHKKSYLQIHRFYQAHSLSVRVGIAKHNICFEMHQNTFWNRFCLWFERYVWNEFFLDRIAQYQDFIGINYYFRKAIGKDFTIPLDKKYSDIGWELYPKGISTVCEEAYRRYKKPIIITEHGLADHHDIQRQWYIEETLESLSESLQKGIDIRGYFHWSFLDNFEWAEGFSPRFGLVEVDYTKEGKRTVRDSATWYSAFIQEQKK